MASDPVAPMVMAASTALVSAGSVAFSKSRSTLMNSRVPCRRGRPRGGGGAARSNRAGPSSRGDGRSRAHRAFAPRGPGSGRGSKEMRSLPQWRGWRATTSVPLQIATSSIPPMTLTSWWACAVGTE